MEMPKPGEAHKKLQRLVGEWSGGETMHPAPWDPTGGPASARIRNRLILDGFGVVQEYEQSRKGAPNFSGIGVFWYDPGKQHYAMTWWDSMMGCAAEYRGHFNGDVLDLQNEMPGGGHSRATFDLGTPGQYTFLMSISQDGQQWAPAMEGSYRSNASKGGKTAKATKSAARARGGTGKRAVKAAGKAAKAAKAKPRKSAKAPKKAARSSKRR